MKKNKKLIDIHTEEDKIVSEIYRDSEKCSNYLVALIEADCKKNGKSLLAETIIKTFMKLTTSNKKFIDKEIRRCIDKFIDTCDEEMAGEEEKQSRTIDLSIYYDQFNKENGPSA